MPSTGRASRCMTPCSSELTGDSVLYDAGHVADKTAPALSGRYSSRDALQSCWPAAACKPSTPPHAH